MSGIQQLLLGGSPAGGYQIERSLRFNSADSAYLNRTPASAGNRKTWTWSSWIKRGSFGGAAKTIISAGASGTNPSTGIQITGNEIIQIYDYTSSYNFQLDTTPVYRDPSSWYHIVVAFDTTQATASNRIKLYVNGSQVTAFSTATYPTQNTDYQINSTNTHYISRFSQSAASYLDGYLTEVNFIDGQALTPSSFGQTNANTGVWEPVKYTGTYGTNGFYLNFSDNSNTTSTTLGKDSSGNGNNWTPNNFSVTAGAGNDSLVDTPTSYGTDTGVGGEVRGNYCTMNPLDTNSSLTISDGNLRVTSGSSNVGARATFGVSSGKWYWEAILTTKSQFPNFGIALSTWGRTYVGNTNSIGYQANGDRWENGTPTSGYAAINQGDIVGIALDMDAGTVTFYRNNTSQWTTTGLSGTYFPALSSQVNDVININFGQRPFTYTAPSGFKALCTQNLPTPTIGATSTTQANKYFDATTYAGNNTTNTITNSGSMAPDFVWIKNRTGAFAHYLNDTVRGAYQILFSNLTNAESNGTSTSDGVSTFNSNGFTVLAGTNKDNYNSTSNNYVAWQWNAGGSNATNTSGTITSTVRANTTAGFSIVTYTGNGTNGATVGHGLGVAPSMIIIKNRDAAVSWPVRHQSLASNNQVYLNNTNAAEAGDISNLGSSTFTVTTWSGVNGNGNKMVAYCFAEISGFSKAFSYTGNGSTDGPFVFTNMRPRYVLIKRTDTTAYWYVYDTARNTINVASNFLYPNDSSAEASVDTLDFVSNGFKLRSSNAAFNASGGTYVGIAFAESPFKYSLAR